MVNLIIALLLLEIVALRLFRLRVYRRNPRFQAVPTWAILLDPTVTIVAAFCANLSLWPIDGEGVIWVASAGTLAVVVPLQIVRYRVLRRAGVMAPEKPAPDTMADASLRAAAEAVPVMPTVKSAPPDADAYVPLAEFEHLHVAELVRGRLEAEGLHPRLPDPHGFRLALWPFAPSVQVLIPASELSRARAIIDEGGQTSDSAA